jgi:predicted DNA-binding transcriptional regulator AlpA
MAVTAPASEARSALDTLSRTLPNLDAATIAEVLPDLDRLRAVAWIRLTADRGTSPTPETVEDRLLTAEEAAARLAVAPDWLYRHADALPFTVRIGDRHLRFSTQGINRYIRERSGR